MISTALLALVTLSPLHADSDPDALASLATPVTVVDPERGVGTTRATDAARTGSDVDTVQSNATSATDKADLGAAGGALSGASAAGEEAKSAPTISEFQRLFGAEERSAEAPKAAPVASVSASTPHMPTSWLWVGMAGAVGLFFARGRLLPGQSEPQDIRVLGKATLGRDGGLALIEVSNAQGEPRRLLVGMGGGAPQLVIDLDEGGGSAGVLGAHEDEEPVLPPTTGSRATPVLVEDTHSERVASARGTSGSRRGRLPLARNPVEVKTQERSLPDAQPVGAAAQHEDPAWERALRRARRRIDQAQRTEPGETRRRARQPRKLRVLPPSLQDRDDLIAEVLAEREGRRPAARRSTVA